MWKNAGLKTTVKSAQPPGRTLTLLTSEFAVRRDTCEIQLKMDARYSVVTLLMMVSAQVIFSAPVVAASGGASPNSAGYVVTHLPSRLVPGPGRACQAAKPVS